MRPFRNTGALSGRETIYSYIQQYNVGGSLVNAPSNRSDFIHGGGYIKGCKQSGELSRQKIVRRGGRAFV